LRGEFGYRLPSESEWEYACRAGTDTRRWWGDKWDPTKENGNLSFEDGKTSPVDNYAANPWGLHDMIGNVCEWCADCWVGDLSALPADGAPYLHTEAAESSGRAVRGGSWFSNPRDLRAAYRSWNTGENNYIGFRVARTLSS
jgi:formylglycine-generating enzyme required for sulfatase activity